MIDDDDMPPPFDDDVPPPFDDETLNDFIVRLTGVSRSEEPWK